MTRHIKFTGHEVEVKRLSITSAPASYPHELIVDGHPVASLTDAEADAIGGLIGLASEALR